MKIGFFTDGYLPQLNGVATSVEGWTEAIRKLGHKVYVIAPSFPNYKDEGEDIIRVPSVRLLKQPEIRLGFPLSKKSISQIYKLKLDVIHATSGGSISTLGLIVARAKKIPYVFTYYTRFNHYTHYLFNGKIIKPQMVEFLSRIFCNKCDLIIAPTQAIKDELLSFGVKKPIAIVPSGVDTAKFKKQEKGFLRKKTGIKKGKILLFIGRLEKEKSVDFLIKAFAQIHFYDSQTNLVLIGDGKEEPKLKKLAKKLKVEKNVYFAGLIDRKDIGKVYQDAEIFVFASQTETQGMVILEALASGLPIVAVNDSVYDGIIEDKINGVLVEPDLKQFAKACLGILSNPTDRERLSNAASKSMQNFSFSQTAKSFEKLYGRLISERSKGDFYGTR